MTHAIRFHKTGGPTVLVWEEVQVGKPGPGEVLIRHTAVGLNFVDIYIRSGLYPVPLPSGIGTEAAGRVEEIGPGVTAVQVGDRVAYAGGPLGAYAEERVMPADRLVVLPDGISNVQAAAMMLKGLTAEPGREHLRSADRRCGRLAPRETQAGSERGVRGAPGGPPHRGVRLARTIPRFDGRQRGVPPFGAMYDLERMCVERFIGQRAPA
jgi:NADPH:quinone reductase-like Zn-dependent oxidoreductase